MTTYTPDELSQLKRIRKSVADFAAMVKALPPDVRYAEYNAQFNELRAEARALLKGQFTEEVPRAITGDVSRDRALSVIAILGVFLALVGFGINSIILEDVLVNSLGCCVSSGGMLLVLGALGVLAMKVMRERVNTGAELSYRAELLLYQLDHRLYMESNGGAPAQPQTPASTPPDLAPPESDEF
ncbi:MAG: hypothetical protein FOGNACKC_04965 [Anaerolineae bacterium]|nr:hypothetical protein [Anaerolineae bacterium]